MARKKHLINVHTSTGTTAPTGASLYLGEIAVQHTPNNPALWIKVGTAGTSTEYEKFIGKKEITNIFNQSRLLGSAYTYTGISYVNSATTIADAYSALTMELIKDEKVTAAALNDLNIKFNDLSASVLTDYVTTQEFEKHELVAAAALNDLNDKIIDLSITTTTHSATTIANRASGQMHLPIVSASDNGKILMVKDGTWVLEQVSTITYSSSEPSGGNDGDIWVQTS